MDFYPFHLSHWPKAISYPHEYDGDERIRLNWDLGIVPDNEKKKIIKAWSGKLPELRHIRWASIWSRVTAPVFDAACRLSELECLEIKSSNLTSLEPIRQLGELRHLRIGSSTSVSSVEPLTALQGLKLLELENFKQISDFSPLLALKGLESLAITGSMWSRQELASLEPFSQMTWLSSLSIDTSSLTSLKPLARLSGLKYLGIGGRLPMEEYAWLSAKLPNTQCQWFAPYLDLADSGMGQCQVCKNQSLVMLTGRGARTVCKVCNQAKVAQHEQVFYEAKRVAAA
jgi:Leucine-rich repeat (LRR) protein